MSAAAPDRIASPLRVLLVEDDEGDALIVEDLLEDAPLPLELVRARTAAEAARLVARVDCALVDLDLPDASGLEALHRLRAAAPSTATIVLTGLADESRGVDAVGAGAQDYLVKGSVDGALLARAIRYAVERRRADGQRRELEAARLEARENARLERGLLPNPLVTDPGVHLAAAYRPGRRRTLLGGDFYDAVQTGDGAVHLVIGDVAGHGPDEAATGVALRIGWRTLVLSGTPDDQVLPTLQEVLVAERQSEEVFTTLAAVTIDPDRRRLHLRLAGHPAPLLLGVGGAAVPVTPLRSGLPLGVLPDARWDASTVDLPRDWALLLYTDGIVEGQTTAGDGARLGDAWLAAQLTRHVTQEPGWRRMPETLLSDLIAAAERENGGPLADDVAILLVS
ncbi:PP2C family protein-serine/threonine phosphatase [Conexibacter sp. SYSU D00693]|uniref:PP2C family protein-serine/threonine phosphatase n=1 Tax=Conexibacter sp. SYSU D00693 TaxID=2812560 RepID=UPI001F11BD33|nr:SpoIIE family protein phosphatase [Conexibacter sp. SYSU D00693]